MNLNWCVFTSQLDDSTVSNVFINKCKRYDQALGSIKETSIRMQEKGASLELCNTTLEALHKYSTDGAGVRGHPFEHVGKTFDCKKWIGVGNKYDTDQVSPNIVLSVLF